MRMERKQVFAKNNPRVSFEKEAGGIGQGKASAEHWREGPLPFIGQH